MDGVVADFNEYAYRTLGFPPSAGIYPEDKWHQLAQNPRIYRDLITTTYAQELYNECVNFSDKKKLQVGLFDCGTQGQRYSICFF